MRIIRRLRAWMGRLGGVVFRGQHERDLAAELDAHVALQMEDAVRGGQAPEDARRAALVQLGGAVQTRERVRERAGLPWVDEARQDGRYAMRTMRRAPGFTVAAVLTLALGIGGTVGIISVVDGILLRPLAYQRPSELVAIHEVFHSGANLPTHTAVPVNAAHFTEWATNVSEFEELSLIRGIEVNLTGSGDPLLVPAARVSSTFFSLLGVRPVIGRAFTREEDQVGRDHVVVISNTLWRQRFASDAGVVGKTVTLDGEVYEVVGVLPQGFRFPSLGHLYPMRVAGDEPQVWKPFAARPIELTAGGGFNFACVGRLRTGVSLPQARLAMDSLQRRLGERMSGRPVLGAAVVPLQEQIVGDSRRGLEFGLAAVGIVLLIACVNVTNLLLVRSSSRGREWAIRTAVGATRGRLVRQVLSESLILSLIGGVVGVGLAYELLPVVLRFAPADLPRMYDVHLDLRLVAYAVGMSLLTGLLVGLLPALRFASGRGSTPWASLLRSKATAGMSRGVRLSLVGMEVAAAAACLVVGGLLLTSLARLLEVNPGFTVPRLLTFELKLPEQRLRDNAARAAFAASAVDRLGALPGVVSAAVSNHTPLSGAALNFAVAIEGGETVPIAQRPNVDLRTVTPDYFATMGIALKAGRVFAETDRVPVAILSSSAANALWPGQDPLGRRLTLGPGPLISVVGVVGDIRTVGLDQPLGVTLYLPAAPAFFGTRLSVNVRTSGDGRATPATITSAIRALDPELAVPVVRTMADVVDESVAQRQFQRDLLLGLAGLALLLAGVGIYGVVSQSVVQRTSEFGIRLALGARSSQLRRLVFYEGMPPVAGGLLVGIAAAIWAGRLLESLLFQTVATDPVTIAGVVFAIATVAVLAMYLPSMRAMRVDPLRAIRGE